MKEIEHKIEALRNMLIEDGYNESNIVMQTLNEVEQQLKNNNLQNVINRFKSVDKYDIWFDQGSKYKREGIEIEKNNDDGEWIKASDVKTILDDK